MCVRGGGGGGGGGAAVCVRACMRVCVSVCLSDIRACVCLLESLTPQYYVHVYKYLNASRVTATYRVRLAKYPLLL